MHKQQTYRQAGTPSTSPQSGLAHAHVVLVAPPAGQIAVLWVSYMCGCGSFSYETILTTYTLRLVPR